MCNKVSNSSVTLEEAARGLQGRHGVSEGRQMAAPAVWRAALLTCNPAMPLRCDIRHAQTINVPCTLCGSREAAAASGRLELEGKWALGEGRAPKRGFKQRVSWPLQVHGADVSGLVGSDPGCQLCVPNKNGHVHSRRRASCTFMQTRTCLECRPITTHRHPNLPRGCLRSKFYLIRLLAADDDVVIQPMPAAGRAPAAAGAAPLQGCPQQQAPAVATARVSHGRSGQRAAGERCPSQAQGRHGQPGLPQEHGRR